MGLTEWLCWSVFQDKLSNIDAVQRSVLDEATTHLEKRAGARLRQDTGTEEDNMNPVTATKDPVQIWSRPGFIYVLRAVLNRLAESYLKWKYGMHKAKYNDLE